MKFYLTSAILILFAAVTAKAEFKKTNCPNIKPQHFENVFLESGATCATAEKIQKQLIVIKKIANINTKPHLFVQKQSYQSFATLAGIVVVNQEQLAWDRVRTQEQNEKIWLHELGHIYFAQKLVEDFEPIKGFYNYMSDAATLAVKTMNPYADEAPEMLSKWKEELLLANNIQTPYNEMFADLVATLATDDALAMVKPMQSPGMPQKAKKETAYYGFAGKYDLKNWNESNPHFFFAPAKAYIGQKYLKFPMDDAQKSYVLKKVFKACLNEIKKHWASEKKLPTASEANQSLIKALD